MTFKEISGPSGEPRVGLDTVVQEGSKTGVRYGGLFTKEATLGGKKYKVNTRSLAQQQFTNEKGRYPTNSVADQLEVTRLQANLKLVHPSKFSAKVVEILTAETTPATGALTRVHSVADLTAAGKETELLPVDTADGAKADGSEDGSLPPSRSPTPPPAVVVVDAPEDGAKADGSEAGSRAGTPPAVDTAEEKVEADGSEAGSRAGTPPAVDTAEEKVEADGSEAGSRAGTPPAVDTAEEKGDVADTGAAKTKTEEQVEKLADDVAAAAAKGTNTSRCSKRTLFAVAGAVATAALSVLAAVYAEELGLVEPPVQECQNLFGLFC